MALVQYGGEDNLPVVGGGWVDRGSNPLSSTKYPLWWVVSLSLYPKQGKLVFVRFSDTGFQENLSFLPFMLRNYQYMYTACDLLKA